MNKKEASQGLDTIYTTLLQLSGPTGHQFDKLRKIYSDVNSFISTLPEPVKESKEE